MAIHGEYKAFSKKVETRWINVPKKREVEIKPVMQEGFKLWAVFYGGVEIETFANKTNAEEFAKNL